MLPRVGPGIMSRVATKRCTTRDTACCPTTPGQIKGQTNDIQGLQWVLYECYARSVVSGVTELRGQASARALYVHPRSGTNLGDGHLTTSLYHTAEVPEDVHVSPQ